VNRRVEPRQRFPVTQSLDNRLLRICAFSDFPEEAMCGIVPREAAMVPIRDRQSGDDRAPGSDAHTRRCADRERTRLKSVVRPQYQHATDQLGFLYGSAEMA